VIATTAERRRKAREVTERRKGDRARRPTPHWHANKKAPLRCGAFFFL